MHIYKFLFFSPWIPCVSVSNTPTESDGQIKIRYFKARFYTVNIQSFIKN
jgi:hypothetical protein